MEDKGKAISTAFGPVGIIGVSAVCNNCIVAFFFFATLIKDAATMACVKHDRIPGLTSRTSYKGQECRPKRLEIYVLVHLGGPI